MSGAKPVVEMVYHLPCGCRSAVMFFHDAPGTPRPTMEMAARNLAALAEVDLPHACPKDAHSDPR